MVNIMFRNLKKITHTDTNTANAKAIITEVEAPLRLWVKDALQLNNNKNTIHIQQLH